MTCMICIKSLIGWLKFIYFLKKINFFKILFFNIKLIWDLDSLLIFFKIIPATCACQFGMCFFFYAK